MLHFTNLLYYLSFVLYLNKILMSLGEKLIKKLEKPFPPKARIDDVFKGNDYTLLTNDNGEAVSLYIGKRKENGDIKGEYYTRKIIKDSSGKIIKNHWDNKGRVG